jgi:hypothetical protein
MEIGKRAEEQGRFDFDKVGGGDGKGEDSHNMGNPSDQPSPSELSIEDKLAIYDGTLHHLTELFLTSGSRTKNGKSDVSDEHGHSAPISFRENPHEIDILDGVYEILPKGLFKTKSDFNRAIFRVGLYMVSHIVKQQFPDAGKQMMEVGEIHQKIAFILKMQRLKDLNVMFESMRRQVLNEKGESPENKIERIKELLSLQAQYENVLIFGTGEGTESSGIIPDERGEEVVHG